jgi:hypothetical protein
MQLRKVAVDKYPKKSRFEIMPDLFMHTKPKDNVTTYTMARGNFFLGHRSGVLRWIRAKQPE